MLQHQSSDVVAKLCPLCSLPFPRYYSFFSGETKHMYTMTHERHAESCYSDRRKIYLAKVVLFSKFSRTQEKGTLLFAFNDVAANDSVQPLRSASLFSYDKINCSKVSKFGIMTNLLGLMCRTKKSSHHSSLSFKFYKLQTIGV